MLALAFFILKVLHEKNEAQNRVGAANHDKAYDDGCGHDDLLCLVMSINPVRGHDKCLPTVGMQVPQHQGCPLQRESESNRHAGYDSYRRHRTKSVYMTVRKYGSIRDLAAHACASPEEAAEFRIECANDGVATSAPD